MAKKALWALPLMVLVAAGLMSLSGCFKTPTNPHIDAFGEGGGNPNPTPGPGPFPTPTPGGPGGGNGSISGTVSGFGTEEVTIAAAEMGGSGGNYTTRVGDGAYTVTGLPAGTYAVTATSASHYGAYGGLVPTTVTVGSGSHVTGINITSIF